jgi:alpha-L-rhamnosidase
MRFIKFSPRFSAAIWSGLAMLAVVGIPSALGGTQPVALRCEDLVNPLGIAEPQPRFSWEMQSTRRADRQTAWEIVVASSPDLLARNTGDLWDSGKVSGDATTGIEYGGPALRSNEHCHWKVRLWDRDGNPSDWSLPASWSMGLLQPGDWKSEWIGYDAPREQMTAAGKVPSKTNDVLYPPACLRSTFSVAKKVKQATLYATALGWFDASLNGTRVNDTFFDPGWTDYSRRVYYRTYDVTGLIHDGANALGVQLADGWFSGYVGWSHNRNLYGTKPRVRLQLHLEYADGSEEDIGTGPDWEAATGPIIAGDLLKGESYDARREIPGWDTAKFDDHTWAPVNVGAEVTPEVQPHPGPPVRVIQEFRAQTITEPKPDVYVLNLGQNFAGVPRLKVDGEPGEKITLRFAERLNPDGTVYTTNLRTATATDTYICRGGGTETWMPRFTFHGFQYIEVTGLKHKPDADTIVGIALSSDTPVAGDFDCDDAMLNRLHKNIYWTQRANFIDIPTDCPQRDERLGWMGDAQIYCRAATLNVDAQAFYTKWLVDVQDAQRADGEFPKVSPSKLAGDDGGPAWADAGVICPWTVYEVYGDRRELASHYDSMCRFIEFCRNRSTPDMLPPAKYHCYGDWLNINAPTPADVICTAYFAYSTHLTARAAEALGKTDDAAKWNALFDQIKAAFNKAYVSPDGVILGDTQCGYVMALDFDLLDPDKAALAANNLAKNIEARGWHLSTGFVGTKDLMLALAKIGRNDIALRLIHNDTYPSWGFSIKQGATSIWERWDGWTPEKGFQDPKMNSFAHYSFGAVYQWMVENLGGIRTDGPAYKNIVIAPVLDEKLGRARVTYHCVHGEIESSWKRTAKGLEMDITIPANTTARVAIPASSVESVTEGGKPLNKAEGVASTKLDGDRVWVEIGSGEYHFAKQ